MNKAFTLIELMIVISMIAIISAIAIPNIMEMKTFSREMNAAAQLKSVIYPAVCAYQCSVATDVDGDGRGEFAPHLAALAGAHDSMSTGAVNALPSTVHQLIPIEYNNFNGSTGSNCRTYSAGGTDYTDRACLMDGYEFGVFNTTDGSIPLPTSSDAVNGAEIFSIIIAAPAHGEPMRTSFAICMNDGYYPRIIATRASVPDADISIKELSKFKTVKGIYNPIDPLNPCSMVVVNDAVGVQVVK